MGTPVNFFVDLHPVHCFDAREKINVPRLNQIVWYFIKQIVKN
jgi:hypothetical protein